VTTVAVRRATPFVKWAGGKGQILGQLEQFFPLGYRTYYEPFIGGGAVFFHLQPEEAVIGDSNSELINCYRIVRDRVDELIVALDLHVYNREHYYQVRALQPSALSAVERAARFIYLNKTCFNGLYRVNRKGQFNVPFGSFKSPPRLYDEENLRSVSAMLRDAKIVDSTFDHTLAGAGPGDFVYLDPPYVPLSESSSFTTYTVDGFVTYDQYWLKAQLNRLTERGCRVVLSNSDTPFTRWLYAEFDVNVVFAARAINSNAEGRQCITELVIRNF
jgi:DNA adenine methylase